MKNIIKNKVSLTLNPQKNERTLSSYQQPRNQITNSAYSLRTSNIINVHKDPKINNNNNINNNNKYLICNTSPNNKIGKNLNLTRTLQNITRSSHSREGILSNKLVHKNNILGNINSNISNNSNFINVNNNRHTIRMSNNNSITNHQRTNLSLTENTQRMKYQRISIKTNINTNSNNINNNISNISSPSNKTNFYANLNKVRISHKAYGIIQAYATITSSGKRNYNEDRVSIIYNIPKPQGYTDNKNNPWPNCSFFGLYDGHGGSAACDFLRDNLHKYIINDKYFPSNPQKAIANGFIYAEKMFFKNYTGLDSSGSCAIVVLIIENRVYIANVGDSRAILSAKNGTKFYPLSRDHRPGDEKEYKRILDAGGKIYKTEYEYGNNNVKNANTNNNRYNTNINNNTNNYSRYSNTNNNNTYQRNINNYTKKENITNNNNNRQNNNSNKINININNYIKSPTNNNKIVNNYINSRYSNNQNKTMSPNVSNINTNKISTYHATPNNNNKTTTTINIKNSSVIGPLRVSPGKLSVSRTIGDIAAKDPKFGGNPNVIISIPEIKYFDNSDKNDFILIICDGVYEKLKNKDIIDFIWKEISKKKFPDIHNLAGYTIEKLVNRCIEQDSSDNLTVIMICLKNYDKLKLFETPVPQTENIEQAKNKKLAITVNMRQKSQSKKPLSMLLTRMTHNNSQNIKKIINLKNKDNNDNKDKWKKNENK